MTEPQIANVARILCLSGAGLGAIGLVGHLAGLQILYTVVPGEPPMMPNTGLALFLIGIAAALRLPERPGRARLALSVCAALAAFVIGFATTAEYVLGLNLPLDELVFQGAAGPHPGRPSPPTAVAVTFLSAAIIVDSRPTLRAASEWLIVGAGIIAFTAILGQLFGAGQLYWLTSAPVTGVAVPTALSLLLAAVGLLHERPDVGLARIVRSPGPGAMLLRRLAPAAVLIPALFGLLAARLLDHQVGIKDVGVVFAVLTVVTILVSLFLLAITAVNLNRVHDALDATRELLPEIVFETDTRGRLIYLNRRGLAITGYTEADLAIGITARDLVVPAERQAVRDNIAKVMSGAELGYSEYTGRRKDGSVYPVLVHSSPIIHGGVVVGLRGAVIDITERKRAEAEQAERNLAVAKALARLNDAHRRLWRTENLKEGLDELLSATIEMLGADMGAIQLVDPTGKVVRIAAHQGLKQDVLDFFREVSAEDDTACGRALRTLTPVVIEDIELDPSYEPFRATGRAAGYRAVVSGPVVDRRGDLLGMLSVHFRAPHRPSDTELQWFDVCRRRTADFIGRCRSVQALRESEERLRLALEGGRIAIFDRDWRTGTFVWNDECYRLLGYKVGEVVPSRAAWLTRIHPDDRAAAETAFECTMRERNDYSNEFRILRPNGSVRWVRSRGVYMYEADEPIRLIGLIEDITEARQQVEMQRVLVAELQHRTRNLIAVVHAIAHQTLNTAASLKDFEQRFDHRLQALSRAQSLLSRADTEPITLGALIGMELEAIGSEGVGDRIRLTGPKVALSKRAVEMLALAIHELATNAVKYGALASEKGQLSVTWEIVGTGPDRRVVLEWVEHGISVPVADDGQRGYGRTLIEQALPYSLSAQTKFELGTDALHCVISLPLATIDTNEAAG